MELNHQNRMEIESMIRTATDQLEKRIELKIDIIIQMLESHKNIYNSLLKDMELNKTKINIMDVEKAERPVSCPYKNRIEVVEKRLDKIIYKTSIITGMIMGFVFYFSPIIMEIIKNTIF